MFSKNNQKLVRAFGIALAVVVIVGMLATYLPLLIS